MRAAVHSTVDDPRFSVSLTVGAQGLRAAGQGQENKVSITD